MSLKNSLKYFSLLFAAGLSIFYVLNRDTIDKFINAYLSEPRNVSITNVTPTSFTVTWSSLAKDYGALIVSNSSYVPKSYLDGEFSNFYYDIRSNDPTDIKGSPSLFTHTVTVTDLTPGDDYYFSITNGSRIWSNSQAEVLISELNSSVQDFYLRLPLEVGNINKPKPLLGHLSPESGNFNSYNLEQSIVVLYGRDSHSVSTEVINSKGLWVTDLSVFDNEEIIDTHYYLSDGTFYSSTLDTSLLKANSRGYYELKDEFPVEALILTTPASANESYCCAYQVDNSESFYGSYTELECSGNSYELQSVDSERLCNKSFEGVCCDAGGGSREWVPRISCNEDSRLENYLTSELCNYTPLVSENISLLVHTGLNILDTSHSVPITTDGIIMQASEFLSSVDNRDITYITQFTDGAWNMLIETEEGYIAGSNFSLKDDTAFLYYSNSDFQPSILAQVSNEISSLNIGSLNVVSNFPKIDVDSYSEVYVITSIDLVPYTVGDDIADPLGYLLIK